jgi:cell division protein ZapE
LRDTPSVTARLQAEVAARHLDVDVAQSSAAARLDVLRDGLQARSPTALERLRLHLPWVGAAARIPLRGVYLWGGVGRGKTLLMDLFYTSLQRSTARAERSHFYHFMRDVHAELRTIKQHADPLDLVAQRLADRAQVVCLDEFFVADIADAMILSGLFAGLFRRGVTLVATSNLEPQDLYKDGLQRQRFLPAIDLIRTHVDVMHLDGGVDYRLRQLEKAPTYLDLHRADTTAALRARFADLAGGKGQGATTLRIEERDLHAADAAPGMVWFEFAELCDGPRSQNDYIELARLYHTIFIANIPLFDGTNENAARRFVMLIDELYDRGVKIVVSAAAPPVALYHGERLKFEFARAASRLIEMQSQDYLAGQHRP